VELVVDEGTESKLKLLCSLSSKLWNEVNYARRRMFFEKKDVDLKATYKGFYEKYKTLIGSAGDLALLRAGRRSDKRSIYFLEGEK
jgi:putative transposase